MMPGPPARHNKGLPVATARVRLGNHAAEGSGDVVVAAVVELTFGNRKAPSALTARVSAETSSRSASTRRRASSGSQIRELPKTTIVR